MHVGECLTPAQEMVVVLLSLLLVTQNRCAFLDHKALWEKSKSLKLNGTQFIVNLESTG